MPLMTNSRIWLLAALHFSAGLLCCLACLLHDGSYPQFAAELAYMVLIGSHMLLIGIAVAIGQAPLWRKMLLGLGGLGYLSAIAYCGSLSQAYWPTAGELLPIFGVLGFPILAIVAGMALVQRWTGVRITRLDLALEECAVPFRFSIRQLVLGMLGFGLVLSALRWLRTDPIVEGAFVVLLAVVLGASALIIVWLLVWAVLGRSNPWRSLVLVLFATATVGLIPPSMQRDAPPFRYVVWPSLFLAIGVIVAGSLLVLRSAGFRLAGPCGTRNAGRRPDHANCRHRHDPAPAGEADSQDQSPHRRAALG